MNRRQLLSALGLAPILAKLGLARAAPSAPPPRKSFPWPHRGISDTPPFCALCRSSHAKGGPHATWTDQEIDMYPPPTFQGIPLLYSESLDGARIYPRQNEAEPVESR